MKECKQRQYHHNNSPTLLCSLSFSPNFWTSQTPKPRRIWRCANEAAVHLQTTCS